MKKHITILFALLLGSLSIWAQETVSISDARSQALGETVTVEGIILNGGELGNSRYLQDETAGIGIFNPDLAEQVAIGDRIQITGQLSEFNNLLQITDAEEGTFSFEILSSGNEVVPRVLTVGEAFSEAYESQLIQINDAVFAETGAFSGGTNYDITDGTGNGILRVDGRTDISGANIPSEASTVIGIMGQYQDNHQLLPRSLADLGLMPPVVEVTTIAEARTQSVGATVEVEGIVLLNDELGNIRFIQDETAGIAVFNNSFADIVKKGDRIRITGQLSEFNNLLQIVDDSSFDFSVISSNNDLPLPKVLNISEGFSETYEGQLVSFEQITFEETGAFSGNTNYTITDGQATGTLRVDSDTDIAGAAIPTAPNIATGIMGQYQDTYQLLPRSLADLDIEEVDPPEPTGRISILEARGKALGETVTIKAIVTSGAELGNIRYMQDETAGIAVFNPDATAEINAGDSVFVTGQLSEFNNLLQIVDEGSFSYQVINSGNELPEPKSILFPSVYNETYESQLVTFKGIHFVAGGGSFSTNSSNYDVTDGFDTRSVRIYSATDIAGTTIPSDTAGIVGIMSQYQDNYQLFPRSLADLADFGNFEQPGLELITIAEARPLADGTTVTVEGIVTTGDEFGPIRYIQDETGGVAIYNPDGVGMEAKRGDKIRITGQLGPFNGLQEIVDGGGVFEYEILSSGNPLPEAKVLSMSDGYAEEYEGQLVKIEGVTFIEMGSFATSSTNYTINDGIFLSNQVRINGTTDLAGTPIPTGFINISGIMGQFNTTYQLLPRGLEDIEYQGNPPVFTSSLKQTNIQTTGFTIEFNTLNEGTTVIEYGLTEAVDGGTISDDNLTTSHSIELTGLEPGTIYYVRARSVGATGDESFTSPQPMATASLSSGDIKVYFNFPVDHSVAGSEQAIYVHEAIADTLKNYFRRAKQTIDMCIYTFDNITGIQNSLLEQADRGIKVRLATDREMDPALLNIFSAHPNVEVDIREEDDYGQGIMHNKFVLIDTDSDDPNDPIVWTGSTNFSNGQLNEDPNHVIIIQDQSLARAFKIEFDQMALGLFKDLKRKPAPTEFMIGGKRVEAYFSPRDDVRTKLKESVRSADTDLYFAILVFTRNDIAYSFVDELEEGTHVLGIMDDDTNPFDEGSAYPYSILADNLGERLKVDKNGYIFHHKYFIVDAANADSDPQVFTGSYNWTNSAQFRNDENSLIIHDKDVANLFYQEFSQRFKDLGGDNLIIFTNVDEVEQKNWSLTLYPNPAQSFLQVMFDTNKPQDMQLQISNLQGQVLYQDVLENSLSQRFQIDIANLPNGIYLLHVNGETKRFVVAR